MTYDPSYPMSLCPNCGRQNCADDCRLGFECAFCFDPISEEQADRTKARLGEYLCEAHEHIEVRSCQECNENDRFVVPLDKRRLCKECVASLAEEAIKTVSAPPMIEEE